MSSAVKAMGRREGKAPKGFEHPPGTARDSSPQPFSLDNRRSSG
jgi:hypothetical protein